MLQAILLWHCDEKQFLWFILSRLFNNTGVTLIHSRKKKKNQYESSSKSSWMASAPTCLREASWKYRHLTYLLIQCQLLWQLLSGFSCFGSRHCEFESCWDTLASFTDLLLTPHTRRRHAFIVRLGLKEKHIDGSTTLSICVPFFIVLHCPLWKEREAISRDRQWHLHMLTC